MGPNDTMKKALTLATAIGVIITMIVAMTFLYRMLQDKSEYDSKIDAISAGTISNKKMDARGGLFYAPEPVYYIYVDNEIEHDGEKKTEIEHDGEKKTETKYFIVEKDIYNKYDIGDWFDSEKMTE